MSRITALIVMLLMICGSIYYYIANSRAQSIGVTVCVSFNGLPPNCYRGPGDVVSGAVGFWGLRAYSFAYATSNGKLININRASDSHACDILSAATGGMGLTANCGTGGDNGQTASAFCNATTCSISKAYDQSGATQCSSAACDLSQSTAANQPTLNLSCNGTLPCMVGTTSANVNLNNTALTSLAEPLTEIYAGSVTLDANAHSSIATDVSANYVSILLSHSGGDKWVLCTNNSCSGAGRVASTALVTSGGWNTVQGVFNAGGTSTVIVNGFTDTGTLTNNPAANNVYMVGDGPGADSGSGGNTGEAGIWGTAFNSAQYNAMCNNQRSYWNTAGSC